MRIVIVHKNFGTGNTLKEIFVQGYGFDDNVVMATNSPNFAMTHLKDEELQIVFCGVEFPGFSDGEIITWYDKSPNRDKFILIAYTGGGRPSLCLASGADDYIAMAEYGLKELGRKIIDCCKKRAAYHRVREQKFSKFAADIEIRL